MTTSNLYANAVFAEHPISLYPLDDDVSYISLISDQQRTFEADTPYAGWTVTNCTADDSLILPETYSPFSEFTYGGVIGDVPTLSGQNIEIESPNIFKFEDLNQDLATFSINMYLYQDSIYVNWYEVGYVYYDQDLEQDVERVSRVYVGSKKQWINFNFSYLPVAYDDSYMRIIIRANVNADPAADPGDYNFIVNGISVGQWSEISSSKSLGSDKVTEAVIGLDAVIAKEYGIQEKSGFYIIEDNKLLAKNEGLPLVYGSDNCTKIIPSKDFGPSLVIPGDGFLFDSGKNKEYTVEFWMRINPETIESRRIFGPVDTDNGLYVRDNVIALVLGKNIGVHPISEWYRPMLVHIVVRQTDASLILNGETVFTIDFDKDNAVFSSENNLLGFYSYEDIINFQIDCFSIYQYPIPANVAKRRFVYGEGTNSPQSVADSFKGVDAYINFSGANYTANKTYPDTQRWSAGYSTNLTPTTTSISSPSYQLPEVYIDGRDINEFYDDNKVVNDLELDTFFTFKPNFVEGEEFYVPDGENWTGASYLFFNSLSFIDKLSSIYAVFSRKEINSSSPLIVFKNSSSFDTLTISIQDDSIVYSFNDSTLYTQTILDYSLIDEYSFAVGLNLKSFSETFGFNLKKFFQSPNLIQMYIAGNGVSTFEGKLRSVSFANKTDQVEISNLFLSNGVVDHSEYQKLLENYCSYKLIPIVRFNRFFLDISIHATWQEYFPLTSFASYVSDTNGNKIYDLDYIQINLGYPSVTEVISQVIENLGWKYSDLFVEYDSPVKKSYSDLANSLVTLYDDYEDLKNNNRIVEYFLNTENSSLKAYVTFQLLSEGSNHQLQDFPNTAFASEVIDAELLETAGDPYKPYLTKFEFADKVVVYPPKSINFKDVAISIHLDIKQDGILTNPIKIKDLELSSRALNQDDFNPIGTESGVKLYPYVKSGIYYNNKEKNPLLISKKRYPYLYLTQTSGIRLLGEQSLQKEFGIAMPVNQEVGQSLSIGAVQMWMKYDLASFPTVSYPIFDIDSSDRKIEFVIERDLSSGRSIIIPRDKYTKVIQTDIEFYQNGKYVKNPIIEINEWNSIGILFRNPLIYDNYFGYINLFRGLTFNNVSYYDYKGLNQTTSIDARTWGEVNYEGYPSTSGDPYNWQYWYQEEGSDEVKTWSNAYIIDLLQDVALTPEDIYKSFTGTNTFVIDDGQSVQISTDALVTLTDASWSRFTLKPA